MADLDRPTIAVPDTPISRPGAGSAVSALSRRLSAAIAMALLGITLCQEHGGAQPVREFPTGTIIPVVVTKAEPDQTYALYLPSSYDPRRTWPVIYAFTPLPGDNCRSSVSGSPPRNTATSWSDPTSPATARCFPHCERAWR